MILRTFTVIELLHLKSKLKGTFYYIFFSHKFQSFMRYTLWKCREATLLDKVITWKHLDSLGVGRGNPAQTWPVCTGLLGCKMVGNPWVKNTCIIIMFNS